MTRKKSFLFQFAFLVDKISQILAYIAVAMLLILAVLVFCSVLARYGFNSPIGFTDELSGYLSAALIFFGLAYTLKENAHIRVDLLYSKFNDKITKILKPILVVVGFVWALPLAIGVTQLWMRYLTENVKSWGGLQISLWIPTLALVIGTAVLLCQMAVEIYRNIKELK